MTFSGNSPRFSVSRIPGWVLVALIIFGNAASCFGASAPYKLSIPFQTNTTGVARVYLDKGDGFPKPQPIRRGVKASDQPRVIDFDLPGGLRIVSLRFELLDKPGEFVVGPPTLRTREGKVVKSWSVSDLEPNPPLQITGKTAQGLKLRALPGSPGPTLLLRLPKPLALPPREAEASGPWQSRVNQIVAALAGLCIVWAALPSRFQKRLTGHPRIAEIGKQVQRSVQRAGFTHRFQWLDRTAATLSDPELIVFNRTSLGILGAALLIFLVFCSLGLHGSSIAIWDGPIAGERSQTGVLLGTPKAGRSDEYVGFTPNIFSQVMAKPAFPVINNDIGGEKSTLFWSQPVNHFTNIPRFLLWPFHVLPGEQAFSVYWNLKGLVLFAGSFLLLMLLTGSKPWLSAASAIWIYFSNVVQWWYSHCLPECIGFACLTLLCAMYVLLTRRRVLLWWAAGGLVVFALNYSLIFYPPFGVPFMLIMLAIGLGILVEKKRLIFGPDPLRIRWWALLGACIVCVLFMGAFLWDTRETLHMIMATMYPGRRVNPGGGDTIMSLYTSFFEPVFSEPFFPSEISYTLVGGANVHLVGLLVLPAIFIVRSGRARFTAIDVFLGLSVVLLFLYIVIGLPNPVAGSTLLSMSVPRRARAALGVAALLLLVRHFARSPRHNPLEAADWRVAVPMVLLLAAGYAYMTSMLNFELSGSALLLVAAVNAALVLFAVGGQAVPFFLVMLGFLLPRNYLINPVVSGFDTITNKALYQEARAIAASDPSRWVVFGSYGSTHIGNFLKFAGVHPINGNKFYPVFAYNQVLDPGGRYKKIWNRFAHVAFVEDPTAMEAIYANAASGNVGAYSVKISARAPALDKLGVKYCLFTYLPPADYLPAVVARPKDGKKQYWIVNRDLLPAKIE